MVCFAKNPIPFVVNKNLPSLFNSLPAAPKYSFGSLPNTAPPISFKKPPAFSNILAMVLFGVKFSKPSKPNLLPTSRMGGHFVQGHVDGTVKILDIIPMEDSAVWQFSFPEKLGLFLVDKGSICLDGISLTIVEKLDQCFTVALIPHTLSVTTWGQKKVDDLVNIEVDIMAKYIKNLMPKEKDEV